MSLPGNGDDLYLDTVALTNAADDLSQIATALATITSMANTALTSLAEYDTPVTSEEIKSALRRWIAAVGDPNTSSPDKTTMIMRMQSFASFLQQVASSYTS